MSGLAPELSRAKYTALFAREARDHLNAARAAVEMIASSTPRAEAIDGIFRGVHTIKGMAAAMGYAAVEEIAHALEDALVRVRDAAPRTWRAAVEPLTVAVDLLGDAVEGTIDGGHVPVESVAVRTVVRQLTDAVTSHDGVDASENPATDAAPPPAVRAATISRTLRVDVASLDRLLDLAGEMTAVRARLAHAAARVGDATLARAVADLGRVSGAVADEVQAARLVDVGDLLADLPRIVRQAARATGKHVRVVTSGGDVVADRAVVDALSEPLVHLLRNAVDHGIETPSTRARAGKPDEGCISVSVVRDGNALVVHVEDDGAGVDRDAVIARARSRGQLRGTPSPETDDIFTDAALLECLALPGLSTAHHVTRVSGRGVGVDAVLARVRALGGALLLDTVAGRGTRFTLRMPLSWAVIPALLVRANDAAYALPLAYVGGTREREQSDGGLRSLAELLDPTRAHPASGQSDDVVLLTPVAGGFAIPVYVDEVIGARDCVLKPVGVPRGAFRITAGATILEGGEVALMLDIPAVTGRSATAEPADRRSPRCPLPPPSLPFLSEAVIAPTIRAR